MKRLAAYVIAVILGLAGGFGIGTITRPTTPDPLGTVATAQSYIAKQLKHATWTSCASVGSCEQTTANGLVYQVSGGGSVSSVVVSLDLTSANKLPQSQQQTGATQFFDIVQHFAGEDAATAWISNEVLTWSEGQPANVTQTFGVRVHVDADAKANVLTITYTP